MSLGLIYGYCIYNMVILIIYMLNMLPISPTYIQLSGFLQTHKTLFKSSLEQSSQTMSNDMVRTKRIYMYVQYCTSHSMDFQILPLQSSDQSGVIQSLRIRATGYMRRINRVRYHLFYFTSSDCFTDTVYPQSVIYCDLYTQECPESVPYTLAVYNAKSHSSSSERQTFLQQVNANQGKLAKLEQVNVFYLLINTIDMMQYIIFTIVPTCLHFNLYIKLSVKTVFVPVNIGVSVPLPSNSSFRS